MRGTPLAFLEVFPTGEMHRDQEGSPTGVHRNMTPPKLPILYHR